MTGLVESISIVIPTYEREQVLIDTIEQLLVLEPRADELIVVDQTPRPKTDIIDRLQAWQADRSIRWFRQQAPSITRAMNRGLAEAKSTFVLFLDDDIRPEPALITAHLQAHARFQPSVVAGRVLQPWHEHRTNISETPFHFACSTGQWVDLFMGGNVSIRRQTALELGGFDENFVRVAYNFEAEFAYRLRAADKRIYFEPSACIHHLRASLGGTRSYGEHLTTIRPDHAVGAYYYIFRTWQGISSIRELLKRPLRAIMTRHHARCPWRIPATLLAEIRGFSWAVRLAMDSPRLVRQPGGERGEV